MELSEWLTIYLKHQDMMKKTIKSIEVDGSAVLVEKDSGVDEWLVEEELDLNNPDVAGIVTLNTKKNLKTLLAHWSAVSDKNIKIIFANPKTNEKWLVVPNHHSRVVDEKHLKKGLESLFSGISEI